MRRSAPPLALLLAAALLAGCGGSRRPARTAPAAHVPRLLGRSWAARADAVAVAAAAGEGCRAERLAASLRDAVISAQTRVPARLRTPLLSAVNGLADRITCTPPARTVIEQTGPSPPRHHEPHGPPKHPQPGEHRHH